MDVEKLVRFYENEGEEELRLRPGGAHYLEFLTAARYLERFLPPASHVLDSCAGTGAYAFWLAGLGHRVTAGDIVSRNVELMRRHQAENPPPKEIEIYEGDALDLSRFAPESFDAVLCMGALYHLHDQKSRSRAVREGLRVLRPGGLLVCTYMNRFAVILNNTAGSLDNIDEILRYREDGAEDVFFADTPAGAERLVAEHAPIIAHIALDGMSNFLHTTTGILDDTGLERWRRYHFATCEEPSLLGAGYHNMILAKKP